MSHTLDEIDKRIKTAKKIVLFKAYACKKLQRRCKEQCHLIGKYRGPPGPWSGPQRLQHESTDKA